MAKYLIHNDISEVLEMIQYQYSIISGYEEKIPQIEMDIIMGNIRRLYEDFFELNRLNQNYKAETMQEAAVALPPVKEDPVKKASEEKLPDKAVKETPAEITEPAREITKAQPPQIKEEPVQQKIEARETPKLKDTGKGHVKKGMTADLFAENEQNTVAEKFKDTKKSLHDKIASDKTEKTVADTIHAPIADLRTGVGVNDRFLLINELFKGSQQDYISAIEEINNQGSYDDALLVLNLMKEQFRWPEKSDGLARLLSLIKRRFN